MTNDPQIIKKILQKKRFFERARRSRPPPSIDGTRDFGVTHPYTDPRAVHRSDATPRTRRFRTTRSNLSFSRALHRLESFARRLSSYTPPSRARAIPSSPRRTPTNPRSGTPLPRRAVARQTLKTPPISLDLPTLANTHKNSPSRRARERTRSSNNPIPRASTARHLTRNLKDLRIQNANERESKSVKRRHRVCDLASSLRVSALDLALASLFRSLTD